MEREAKDQELREDRIRFQEERDRMQRTLSEKEGELKLLRKVESEKREIESAVTAERSRREETKESSIKKKGIAKASRGSKRHMRLLLAQYAPWFCAGHSFIQ